jgi:hypothetical protein
VTSREFERFAGLCAIAVGVSGIGFAAAFLVFLRNADEAADAITNVLLVVGGLLSTAVFLALYDRLRQTDAMFALWGLILGIGGAFGSVAHGGFDLANIVDDPDAPIGFPSPTDPRGLFTFAITGLGALVFAWLIVRGGLLPRALGYVAATSGLLLIALYFSRLIVFDPESPGLLALSVLVGFVVNPAFYIWAGLELRRGRREAPALP